MVWNVTHLGWPSICECKLAISKIKKELTPQRRHAGLKIGPPYASTSSDLKYPKKHQVCVRAIGQELLFSLTRNLKCCINGIVVRGALNILDRHPFNLAKN